jgi:peptidyl-prolyl cis-trans isomerase A (cyclophilin A)
MEEFRTMHFMKLLATTTIACIAALPAVSQTGTPAAKPKAAATAKPVTAAKAAATFDPDLLHPNLLKTQAPATYQVKFDTTKGIFTLTVTRAWSPLGADRFYNLVKHHYFDNAPIFRVVPGFVAQFGLSAYPKVSAAWEKATIKDDPHTQSNAVGTIVFATSGPNTRTTQLFINLRDNTPSLDGQGFTPFGAVDADGMSVVSSFYNGYGDTAGMDQDAIASGGKKYTDTKWPKLDVIKSATLVPAAKPAVAKPAARPAARPATGTAAKPATSSAPKPQ